MLGVPLVRGGSDSQDLDRTVEALDPGHGLSLVEAIELLMPPIVNEIKRMPEELRGFYMYLRQAFGPMAQGPVALISRHGGECVFSVDALGLRPLWQLETADGARVLERAGHRRDRGPGRRAEAARARGEGHGRGRARPSVRAHRPAVALPGALAGRGAGSAAAFAEAIPTGGPLEGQDVPGYTSAGPSEPVEGRGSRAGRLRLAARGHEARAADGRHRRGADRLARLRRPARLPLARAPEPGRLLQGVGGRGDQPGDRPRARDRALLVPRGLRRAAAARPRAGAADHDRDRLRRDPRRTRRAGPARRLGLPRRGARAQDLPARGPLGGVPRPRARDRPLVPRVGGHARRDRAPQAGGHRGRAQRGRAARDLRPHGLRGRSPLPRSPPRPRRRRPGAARAPGRAGRGQPAPALRDRAALGRAAQRARHGAGARPRRRRGVPLHDGRGRADGRLPDRHLEPLRRAAQGDREGDLDARHPRGARLRAAVLLHRAEAGADRDLRDAGVLRLRAWRRGLRRARPRRRRASPRPRGRPGGAAGQDVPLLPEGLQGRRWRRRPGRGSYEDYSLRVRELEAQQPVSLRHLLELRPGGAAGRRARPPRSGCTPIRS